MKFKLLPIVILLFISFRIPAQEPLEKEDQSMSQKIDNAFRPIVDKMGNVLFVDVFAKMGLYDPTIHDKNGNIIYKKNKDGSFVYTIGEDGKEHKVPLTTKVPLVVTWLIFGAVFFTLFMKFINFKGFKHSIDLVRGVYDDPDEPGEVTHFQALTTALSATVGLGNIAGVAIAVSLGGPGATFWMIVAGLLGMASKFTECTLGVKYRRIVKGVVFGGPMYYLSDGLAKKGKTMAKLGLLLSGIFAVLVIGGSFGGGNMFQANQAFSQLAYVVPSIENQGFGFGVILAILVGIVIVGGIQSIAKVTDKIVPFMAILYVGTALFIIIMNIGRTGEAFGLIFSGAFSPEAMKGGLIGVLIVGFQRAAFSNEAGVGSAAIAHSAVKTDRPITEGFVALLEPFIDTVVICTMTALVLIFTGTYDNSAGLEGAQLTSKAFATVIPWFPYLLVVAIFLFAFSTMISWSYYGLNGFLYLFGNISKKLFGSVKVARYFYFGLFLVFIVVGASSNLGSVMDFSDMMILSMAFPNIIGLLILAPEVRQDLKIYLEDLKSGKIKRFK
jgi:AGCS family alanine or glycine:cation symporter